MSTTDPTDNALAAIASMLDQSEAQAAEAPPVVTPPPIAEVPVTTEADGYSKTGPGPIAALRFKWTARRGSDAEFFVDETIGEHSRPLTSGPMSADEAIRLVDTRDREARMGFEDIKTRMAVSNPVEPNARDSKP